MIREMKISFLKFLFVILPAVSTTQAIAAETMSNDQKFNSRCIFEAYGLMPTQAVVKEISIIDGAEVVRQAYGKPPDVPTLILNVLIALPTQQTMPVMVLCAAGQRAKVVWF